MEEARSTRWTKFERRLTLATEEVSQQTPARPFVSPLERPSGERGDDDDDDGDGRGRGRKEEEEEEKEEEEKLRRRKKILRPGGDDETRKM